MSAGNAGKSKFFDTTEMCPGDKITYRHKDGETETIEGGIIFERFTNSVTTTDGRAVAATRILTFHRSSDSFASQQRHPPRRTNRIGRPLDSL